MDTEDNKLATSFRFPQDYLAHCSLRALCVCVDLLFPSYATTHKGNTAAQLADAYFISFSCFTAHYCHPK